MRSTNLGILSTLQTVSWQFLAYCFVLLWGRPSLALNQPLLVGCEFGNIHRTSLSTQTKATKQKLFNFHRATCVVKETMSSHVVTSAIVGKQILILELGNLIDLHVKEQTQIKCLSKCRPFLTKINNGWKLFPMCWLSCVIVYVKKCSRLPPSKGSCCGLFSAHWFCTDLFLDYFHVPTTYTMKVLSVKSCGPRTTQ